MEDRVLGLSKLLFTVIKTVPGKAPQGNVVPISPSCKIELTAMAPQGPPAAASRTEASRISTSPCTEPCPGLSLGTKKEKVSVVQSGLFVTPWTVAHQAPLPWDFPGKYIGVGCHFHFQGIFPTQGSNSGLPHCMETLYHLSHQVNPRKTKR